MALSSLRNIRREIRKVTNKDFRDIQIYQYILQQYRKFQVTELKNCRGRMEAQYMAQTYLCYLESSRKYLELYNTYHGKGERSVQETANLVGLNLPKLYQNGGPNPIDK